VKVQCKQSNRLALLAPNGSSLDRQKSRNSQDHGQAEQRTTPNRHGNMASSPRWHRRVPANNHPGTLARSVEEGVELGPAHGDGSAVGQGHRTAGCINDNDKVAFRHQIRFDEQFDLAHARTTALGASNVKRIARFQSQDRVTNRINSIEHAAPDVADTPKVSAPVCRRNPGPSCVSATPQLERE
jgi:hypothetical protein